MAVEPHDAVYRLRSRCSGRRRYWAQRTTDLNRFGRLPSISVPNNSRRKKKTATMDDGLLCIPFVLPETVELLVRPNESNSLCTGYWGLPLLTKADQPFCGENNAKRKNEILSFFLTVSQRVNRSYVCVSFCVCVSVYVIWRSLASESSAQSIPKIYSENKQ